MKTLPIKLVLLGLIFVWGNLIAQDKGKKTEYGAVGSVNKIIKYVFYKEKGKDYDSLKKIGQPVFNDELIKTQAQSFAIIKYMDKSTSTVQPNSEVTIHGETISGGSNSVTKANTTLQKGGIYFKVTKQNDKSDFKFTTPTMVASIRGTSGLVEAENDTLNSFSVEEGLVDIKALYGTEGSGSVSAGKTALVNKLGEVLILETTPEQINKIKKAKDIGGKSIIIKTPSGDLIIDY